MEAHPYEPFANETWIIDLIILEKLEIPGQVREKWRAGPLAIYPLVDSLRLKDGTSVKQFFLVPSKLDISCDQYVKFYWDKPGERGFDSQGKAGDPRGVVIQIVTKEEAENLQKQMQESLAYELRCQLQDKLNQLQQEQKRVAQQVEELAQIRTQELRNKIKAEEENLAQEKTLLDAECQRLNEQQKYLESLAEDVKNAKDIWIALEPYRAAVPLVIDSKLSETTEPCPLPENLGTEWNQMLHSSGLSLPKYVSTSYLLALFSSFYSGSLILLNGSVGVGKTSLIQHSASLLGGQSRIIPVRPAWLDPSDLLGFFDPLSETFRPTPFLTALKDANNHYDRLHLVCLDELNLAKIENYGADLLSALEYSRSEQEKQGLQIYSSNIETELWEEARLLHEEQQRDYKQIQRLKRLEIILKDYASNFPIPKNIVLLGTLNSDETTYDLSPKVIDRSFVITYPLADLTAEIFSQPVDPKSIARNISVSSLRERIKDMIGNTIDGWEIIVKWNKEYLTKLGIPLGHRAKKEYTVFSATANCLGLTQNDCLGYFLFTKVLPRISFFKGTDSNNLNREELCSKWFTELAVYRDFGVSALLTQMQDQLEDDRRRNVRYWG
ncbi:AAA family ATPase [Floridanema aerugineum]|uniref:AAA family ATPase n=1 Tax=Floridaenema aerugineum BLCC-F46 TaxID=3153654 RepID=A0ABV4X9T2_9CYAN